MFEKFLSNSIDMVKILWPLAKSIMHPLVSVLGDIVASCYYISLLSRHKQAVGICKVI